MKTEAFIIHLARAESRKPQVDHIRASLSIRSHVVSAVDGQDLSDEEVGHFFRPRLMRPRYPFALGRNEIACFLSHRKCWQLILEKQLDFGLVIEDDVNLDSPELSALIDFNVRNARPSDFVRFPKALHNEQGPEVAREDGMVQIEPLLPGLGMQMQLVGREAARDLLEATRWFDRPVDAFVQMQWRHNTRVLSARPKAISEKGGALGGTTVQNGKRGIPDRIRHEFYRPAYRAVLRASNARWRNGKDAAGLVDNLIVVEANRYGLGQDAGLLADMLRDLGQSALIAGYKDRSRFSRKKVARRIIHLERVFPSWFGAGLETTLIPNPEWFRPRLVSQLRHVDRILAKTEYGAEVFSRLGPPRFSARVRFNRLP